MEWLRAGDDGGERGDGAAACGERAGQWTGSVRVNERTRRGHELDRLAWRESAGSVGWTWGETSFGL
jgi:hypothetical protein